MTGFAVETNRADVRRRLVADDHVACRILGSVELDRCRECDLMLRLERGSGQQLGRRYVVCAARMPDFDLGTDF